MAAFNNKIWYNFLSTLILTKLFKFSPLS